MKLMFTVSLLLLAVVNQAAPSRSKQRTEDSKTEKRALVEGNVGIEKRAPVIPTALPSVSPGIEYADSKDVAADKSPQRQIYATPVPQLAKISDVLTGQGPPYQAAIASHLFAPVSIYQTRLGSPAYEISAPVPAQLAYTENISYQPKVPQQFTPQVFKQPKQTNYRLAYQPVQYQAVNQYQTPQVFQISQNQQPQVFSIPQNQQPRIISIPQQYQPQLFFSQFQNPQIPQQVAYEQQPLSAPPGIVYAQEDRPAQRDLKTAQNAQPVQNNLEEKRVQNYNAPNQGAISFASFSLGPPAQNQVQNEPQYQQYQNQAQNVPRYQQALQAQQYQPQIQQYQTQATPSQPLHQYQIQREPVPQINTQVQHYNHAQGQVQIQPQVLKKLEPSPANSISVPTKPVPSNPGKDIQYSRPNVVYQPQAQLYQNQDFSVQNPYGSPTLVPSYPPIQFFGKFAHDIFRHYPQ